MMVTALSGYTFGRSVPVLPEQQLGQQQCWYIAGIQQSDVTVATATAAHAVALLQVANLGSITANDWPKQPLRRIQNTAGRVCIYMYVSIYS